MFKITPNIFFAIGPSSSPHSLVTIVVVDHQPLRQLQRPPPLSFLSRTHLIVPSLCVSLIASKTNLLWTHHSPQSISRIAVMFWKVKNKEDSVSIEIYNNEESTENIDIQYSRVRDSEFPSSTQSTLKRCSCQNTNLKNLQELLVLRFLPRDEGKTSVAISIADGRYHPNH